MRRSLKTTWLFAVAMGAAGVVSGCDLFTPEGRQPRDIYDVSPDGVDGSNGGAGFDGIGATGDGSFDGSLEFDGSVSNVDRCSLGTGDDGTQARQGQSGSPSPLPQGFSFESQYRMRISTFEFTDDSPGSVANAFLPDFLDQSREYPIVVLLHLKSIRPSRGLAELRGGAGTKVDKQCTPEGDEECEYTWEDGVDNEYTDVRLHPRSGEIQGGLKRLDFIGTTQFEGDQIEKFTLPIHDIFFEDAFLRPTEDGGVTIEGGVIQGYITQEEAEANEVALSADNRVTIASLLDSSPLNHDSDGDGEPDSWCLRANFSAIETNITEP